MQRDSDEDAWRAIVENYGERVELDDPPAVEPPATTPTEPPAEPPAGPTTYDSGLQRLFRPLPGPPEPEDDLDDEFVPEEPPPLPRPTPDRLLAWLGLFGSPTVLLVCLVFDIRLPPWLGYLLIGAFVGGFGYLVANMPRRDDIDPWDDGARL